MSAWTPLLTGALAERANAVIDDIVRALGDAWPARADFGSGCAGLAMLFAQYGTIRDDAAALDRAAALLGRAVELAGDGMPEGLLEGFAGFGWIMEQLAPAEPDDEVDALVAVDRFLTSRLATPRWDGLYEVLSGLSGMAIYALARAPRPAAHAMLDRIVFHLEALAERTPRGTTWFTPPHHMAAWQRARAPDGIYNLGIAHGVPGVIAILAELAAAGVARAEPLARDAMAWLLAHGDSTGGFASWVGSPPARTAWCYGDPGVAIAVLRAARRLGEPRWETFACELARAFALRDPDDSGVADGGLCHGAFGLAHISNRLWHATALPELRAAAIAWIERGLALRTTAGIAGFPAVTSDGIESDPGVLTGAAGIALALLAATSELPPSWDRMLLLDVE